MNIINYILLLAGKYYPAAISSLVPHILCCNSAVRTVYHNFAISFFCYVFKLLRNTAEEVFFLVGILFIHIL